MTARTQHLIASLLIFAAGVLLGGTLLGHDAGQRTFQPPLEEVDEYVHAVSHIVIPVRRDRPDGQARKLIGQVYRRLLAGEDFATLARARSRDSSAPDGGFLGFVQTQFDTSFAGAVEALSPGTTSPPLRTDMGWHIIKRHTFRDARELEQRYWIPTLGFFVPWEGIEGGERGRSKEQALALAQEARAQLAGGRLTLAEAGQLYSPRWSHGPEAYVGLTARRPGQEHAFDALQEAQPGRILEPIETPRGWAVFVRGRYLRSLVRHILVQHVGSEERSIDVQRTREAAAAVAQRALDEVLADRSRWDAVVARASDDERSRERGGTMGVLTPGAMPPGFERVIYDLPAGEICKHLVETPFGFHVIWKVN